MVSVFSPLRRFSTPFKSEIISPLQFTLTFAPPSKSALTVSARPPPYLSFRIVLKGVSQKPSCALESAPFVIRYLIVSIQCSQVILFPKL